jgi:RimJ/RimL family protein N-acetyltransferase
VTESDWFSRPTAEAVKETAAPVGASASTVMSAGTVSSGSRVVAADDLPAAPVRASSASGTTTAARLILSPFFTRNRGIWINRAVDLRGKRVILRPWRLEDVPAVTAACQDAEIARWLALVPQPYGEADARFYIEQCLASADDRRPFAIDDASTGDLAGAIDLRISHLKTGHVGYWVAPQARGRGVAADALVTLSRWAFDSLGLGRMELVTDPENVPSQRAAEKAGFQREGVLRAMLPERGGGRRDGVMFSLLPGELD